MSSCRAAPGRSVTRSRDAVGHMANQDHGAVPPENSVVMSRSRNAGAPNEEL